jgi:pimeloyl-ACP methyl ester carboxylesterase
MHNFSRYSNKSTIYEFANSGHLPFEEETERFVSLVKEYIASESR